MTTDNETIEEIVKEMRSQFPPKYCSSKSCRVEIDQPVRTFADRIEAAYMREKAELRGRLNETARPECDNLDGHCLHCARIGTYLRKELTDGNRHE